MPLAPLCTRTEIETILSQSLTDGTVDEVAPGTPDDDLLDSVVSWASTTVYRILSGRYTTSQIAGSNPPTNTPDYCRWAAAVIAAYRLMTRRGMAASEMLEEEYRKVVEDLRAVANGKGRIPGVPELEQIPAITNYHIDGSWPWSKVRKVPATSTGTRQPADRLSKEVNSFEI